MKETAGIVFPCLEERCLFSCRKMEGNERVGWKRAHFFTIVPAGLIMHECCTSRTFKEEFPSSIFKVEMLPGGHVKEKTAALNRREFGERIYKVRKQLKKTQQQLADAMGMSAEHLGRVEAGRKVPGSEWVACFAKATHASPSWLFFGYGDMFMDVETDGDELIGWTDEGEPEIKKQGTDDLDERAVSLVHEAFRRGKNAGN